MIASDTNIEPSVSGVSWAAVAAGGIASCAITLMLLSFGIGIGFSVVSPWGGSVSPTTFKIGTGLYFIVMAMMSSAIGGFLAGRLRTKWVGVHANEVYFRDTAHGFLAWAFATVFAAVLLASAGTIITGGVAAGAAQSAGMAASNMSSGSPADRYVDLLLRTDNSSAATTAAPNAGADVRPELVRLFTRSASNNNDLAQNDRTYVARVVAARTGLSQPDAEKRVNDVVTQAKTDADNARKVTLQMALWLVASLLAGAFSASLAATEGGEYRDRNWGVQRTALNSTL